jgi:transposase-like protein
MSELKLNYTLKRKLPKILELLRQGELGTSAISTKLCTSPGTVKKIARAYGIDIKDKRKRSKALNERNQGIIELLTNGKYTYREIARKYNVTPQRIQQIALEHGNIKLHALNHKKKEYIVKQMMTDTSTLSYGEIKSKYKKLEGFKWNILKDKFKEVYGLSIYDMLYSSRNNTILKKYSSGQIAKEVLKGKEHELKSPKHLKQERDVYRVSSKLGYRRHQGIYNRAAGGIFESKRVLNLIVKWHDTKGMSFKAITDKLNSKGYKTVTGLDFKVANVWTKYHNYKTKGKKLRTVKN